MIFAGAILGSIIGAFLGGILGSVALNIFGDVIIDDYSYMLKDYIANYAHNILRDYFGHKFAYAFKDSTLGAIIFISSVLGAIIFGVFGAVGDLLNR